MCEHIFEVGTIVTNHWQPRCLSRSYATVKVSVNYARDAIKVETP